MSELELRIFNRSVGRSLLPLHAVRSRETIVPMIRIVPETTSLETARFAFINVVKDCKCMTSSSISL